MLDGVTYLGPILLSHMQQTRQNARDIINRLDELGLKFENIPPHRLSNNAKRVINTIIRDAYQESTGEVLDKAQILDLLEGKGYVAESGHFDALHATTFQFDTTGRLEIRKGDYTTTLQTTESANSFTIYGPNGVGDPITFDTKPIRISIINARLRERGYPYKVTSTEVPVQ